MSIRCKADIVHALKMHRHTFAKRVLPDLLVHIGWTKEQWRTHHKSYFDMDTSLKIGQFLKKYEEIL